MTNIAVTGGIGAGKSTLIKMFKDDIADRHMWYRFYSMDQFVDELYKEREWLDWLKERFGTCDRKELSNRAFACDSVRAALNSQSALKIGVKLGRVLSQHDSLYTNIIEFPLLFETQMQNEFDKTILITASTDVRIQRVVARGKKTAEEAGAVINAQMSEDKKKALANLIIDTTSISIDDCYQNFKEGLE